jgi:quercetin dioxygenase-like cupin family protein
MDQRQKRHGTTVSSMTPVGPSPSNVFNVLLHETPRITTNSAAMIATVTIPPGDPGSGPHRHSGPVFGYVVEGEILFELEGERPYPIKAGEAFWEPGFETVHYQAANLRADIASKFVVFMLCAPDVPMMIYLDAAEIAGRAHLRRPG